MGKNKNKTYTHIWKIFKTVKPSINKTNSNILTRIYTRLFKTEVAVPFWDEINLVGLAQDFFSGKNRKKKKIRLHLFI